MLETQIKEIVFWCSESKFREGIAWENAKGW